MALRSSTGSGSPPAADDPPARGGLLTRRATGRPSRRPCGARCAPTSPLTTAMTKRAAPTTRTGRRQRPVRGGNGYPTARRSRTLTATTTRAALRPGHADLLRRPRPARSSTASRDRPPLPRRSLPPARLRRSLLRNPPPAVGSARGAPTATGGLPRTAATPTDAPPPSAARGGTLPAAPGRSGRLARRAPAATGRVRGTGCAPADGPTAAAPLAATAALAAAAPTTLAAPPAAAPDGAPATAEWRLAATHLLRHRPRRPGRLGAAHVVLLAHTGTLPSLAELPRTRRACPEAAAGWHGRWRARRHASPVATVSDSAAADGCPSAHSGEPRPPRRPDDGL